MKLQFFLLIKQSIKMFSAKRWSSAYKTFNSDVSHGNWKLDIKTAQKYEISTVWATAYKPDSYV